jgi:ATP-dependent helicase HrpB
MGHLALGCLLAARRGQADQAARLTMLLQERGLGGPGEDLARRLERWRGERGARQRPRADARSRHAPGQPVAFWLPPC